MSRARTPPAVLFLLAALAAGPARAEGPACAGDFACERILLQADPFAATNFLKDAGAQASWKARDPELFQKIFARAAELKDVEDLLHGPIRAEELRLSLAARPAGSFCRKPPELLAWIRANFPYFEPERLEAVRRALWQWDTLDDGRRDYLSRLGVSPRDWDALELGAQKEALRGWADAVYAEAMASLPKSRAELESLKRSAAAVNGLLDVERTYRLWGRINAAEAALNALEAARLKLGPGADPGLEALLDQAQSAPDLETQLALLSRLMDGLGIKNEALSAAVAPKSDQVFDAQSRALLASLLAPALMSRIEGSWAGEDLKAFYAGHALDLRVAPSPYVNSLAHYAGGTITLNESYIRGYVQSKGRSLEDLAKDPALLSALAAALSPVFVHEATHQRQDAWAREKGLPFLSGQQIEVEAMQAEALYILEKSELDPSFRALLQGDAASSMIAREYVRKADLLMKGGPAYLRAVIKAEDYPQYLSLEGKAWTSLARDAKAAADIKAELKRRAALPPAQAAALEDAPGFSGPIADEAAWRLALKTVGTRYLRQLLAVKLDDADAWPKVYAAYRDRLDAANKTVEERLALLLAGKNPGKTNAKKDVPSPPAGGNP